MFVRFRQQRRRLNASLIETRRVAGKIATEHIGALGSVDADVSVRERLAFWAKLPQRLDKLGNRVGSDQHPKIYAAVAARIPVVTQDEQREVKLENAKADEQTWSSLRDLDESKAQGHEQLSAKAKTAAEHHRAAAAEAGAQAGKARERIERLERGDDVPGGFSKPLDFKAVVKMLKEAGYTTRDIKLKWWGFSARTCSRR
jgi:hypothetical protein